MYTHHSIAFFPLFATLVHLLSRETTKWEGPTQGDLPICWLPGQMSESVILWDMVAIVAKCIARGRMRIVVAGYAVSRFTHRS